MKLINDIEAELKTIKDKNLDGEFVKGFLTACELILKDLKAMNCDNCKGYNNCTAGFGSDGFCSFWEAIDEKDN